MDKRKILEELGGLPEEVYDDLCRMFIEDAKAKMLLLKLAVENKDDEKIKFLCVKH